MIAVYRLLYPWDFLWKSVESITDYVERIYIFVDREPWGRVGLEPHEQKSVRQAMVTACNLAVENPKVIIMGDHVETPVNQFTHLINNRVLPIDYKGTDGSVMVIEPDMVFRKDQVERAIRLASEHECCMTKQVEIWKGFRHRVPDRPHRTGVCFWKSRNIPKTLHQANVSGMPVIDAFVHNFGFSVSGETMRTKHTIAIRMSKNIGDCQPNVDWYEKKWLNWEPGMKDLEISIGYEHDIPEVVPYPIEDLPKSIKRLVSE